MEWVEQDQIQRGNQNSTRQSTYLCHAKHFILNPTDRPDLHSDLNQNLISLFLPHTQLIHQVSSESIHNFFKHHAIQCIIFDPHLSMVKNHLEIMKKFSYPVPDPDLHQNLINSSLSNSQRVYQVLSQSVHNFEISCSRIDKTEKRDKNITSIHIRWQR